MVTFTRQNWSSWYMAMLDMQTLLVFHTWQYKNHDTTAVVYGNQAPHDLFISTFYSSIPHHSMVTPIWIELKLKLIKVKKTFIF